MAYERHDGSTGGRPDGAGNAVTHDASARVRAAGALISPGADLAAPMRIASGWAYGFRLLSDGRRLIVDFLVPGDRIDPAIWNRLPAGFEIRALSDVALVPADTPASWHDGVEAQALVDGLAPALEHLVSLGRRTAYERMAVMLLRFWERLNGGEWSRPSYPLPLRQEHMADHLGLSVVHVSRTLSQLRRDSLATVANGSATLHRIDDLMRVADYAPPGRGRAASGGAARGPGPEA